MGNIYGYMRISTKEERGLQRFTRQESALERWQNETGGEVLLTFKDDASGKSFDRAEWQKLMKVVQPGDTIVMADICRFTREYEAGFKTYMELLEKGVELIFLKNPTVSTSYIKNMMRVADQQENRIAKKTLQNTIELLLLVELDRAEQERQITSQRIRDGIQASPKKSGRAKGHLDKMTDELREDLKAYQSDRSIKAVDIMEKHGISRNTFKKYLELTKEND